MSVHDETARTDSAGIQALSSRSAGYSVAAKCLEVQAAAERRDPSLRTVDQLTLADDAWSWYTGTLGEIEVGRLLAQLGPTWFVRHAVPIGSGTKDVDHLVIGPGGVFAINTKHHAAASIWVGDFVLRVNGSNTHHLKEGRADGIDVSRRLSGVVDFPVPVRSIIALVSEKSITDRRPMNNRPVAVIGAQRLVPWLLAQPHQLSTAKLGLITLAAEEPSTWHVDPHAADTLRVMQRFERLANQVGRPASPLTATATARRSPSPRGTPPGTPSRPGATPLRPPSRPGATPLRPPSRPGAKRRRSKGAAGATVTVADLFTLWLSIGAIFTAIFVFRTIANQPCTSPGTCLVPVLYLGVRPLLEFGIFMLVAVGVGRTLLWIVRRLTR